MVDLIIAQHEAQPTYFGCHRRCKNEDAGERCAECLAYKQASEWFRNTINTPGWTVSGLPDQAEPPHCLCANPSAQARWVRAWELREELIRRAKLRLGEA